MESFDLATLRDQLVKAGLKATQQRLVVWAALRQSDNHPSAEQVYERVRQQNPTISLATVYKSLDALVQAGLSQRVLGTDGKMRYDPEAEEHYHLIANDGQEIADYKDPALAKLLQDYFEKNPVPNFEVTNLDLKIIGQRQGRSEV